MGICIKKNGGDHLFVWNPCCFLPSDPLSRIPRTHRRQPPLQVSTCVQFPLNMNIQEKAAPFRLYLLPGVRTVGQRHRTSTVHLRSEEHTSELQSRGEVVCRLRLVK